MATRDAKTARLDHVLLRLGYVTEAQITRALQRQKAHGGRLGMHLVRGGDLTEAQLAEALAIQFDLAWVPTVERDAPADLMAAMPPGSMTEHLTLPMAWDPRSQTLRLVIADPTDHDTVERAKAAFGARRVSIVLAPVSVLQERVGQLTGAREAPADEGSAPVVELPELFHHDDAPAPERAEDIPDPGRSLLMVTAGAAHRNFLPAVFDRESCTLRVAANVDEVRTALEESEFDGVLVSNELADSFAGWVREGRVPAPRAEVSVFTSVTSSLLENPVPYEAMSRSLRVAVQALAEQRWGGGDAVPSQTLVADDLALLADRYGLRRLVRHGLQLAAHLLAPASVAHEAHGEHADPFTDFSESLSLAARLRFPFKLDELLAACHALYHQRSPSDRGTPSHETHLAAQMLAIVWFRHHAVHLDDETDAALMTVLGAALRKQAGRLASMEMVEVYLRLLAERGGASGAVAERDVMLLGDERLAEALASRLSRVGCRTVISHNLKDARTVIDRRAPAAIVIDAERFGDFAARFARIARLDGNVLLYALTDTTDPATTLALLDAGADDVFQPEHDFDLIAARISRAVRARSRRNEPSGFKASFAVFSFLDLVQALTQARKTARIELTRGIESAEVFVRDGLMEHAEYGRTTGTEAVYRVIAWEDDGEFTVHPEQTAHLRTIQEPTDAVLMEGCRLLDESRAPA